MRVTVSTGYDESRQLWWWNAGYFERGAIGMVPRTAVLRSGYCLTRREARAAASAAKLRVADAARVLRGETDQ